MLTKEQKIKQVVEILKFHGIEMQVDGCGCCGSPGVTFEFNGVVIADDESDFNFNTKDVTND